MREKIPISRLIESLREVKLYDSHTMRKLDILTTARDGPPEISQKETPSRNCVPSIMDQAGIWSDHFHGTPEKVLVGCYKESTD